jgi:hypothetical protein
LAEAQDWYWYLQQPASVRQIGWMLAKGMVWLRGWLPVLRVLGEPSLPLGAPVVVVMRLEQLRAEDCHSANSRESSTTESDANINKTSLPRNWYAELLQT